MGKYHDKWAAVGTTIDQQEAALNQQIADLQSTPPPAGSGLPALTVVKPTLTSPTTKQFPVGYDGSFNVTGDVHVTMPKARQAGWKVNGGHNVIVDGGTTILPDLGDTWTLSNLWERRASAINGTTGIAYVAGQWAKGAGLSEGLQVNIPGEFRGGHLRFDWLHVKDHVNYSDNHPDLVQVMRADGGVTLDGFAGVTDMQGIMIKHEPTLGASPFPFYKLRNGLIHGGQWGEKLLNIVDVTTPIPIDNVCIYPSAREISNAGGNKINACYAAISPRPVSHTVLAGGKVRFNLDTSKLTHLTILNNGVYYDPALDGVDPVAAVEAFLPGALMGDAYAA